MLRRGAERPHGRGWESVRLRCFCVEIKTNTMMCSTAQVKVDRLRVFLTARQESNFYPRSALDQVFKKKCYRQGGRIENNVL